jgi:hypothetical protein
MIRTAGDHEMKLHYGIAAFTTTNYISLLYSVWLRTGRPGDRGSIPGRGKGFLPLASVFTPALGPTQPPVQWVPGFLPRG